MAWIDDGDVRGNLPTRGPHRPVAAAVSENIRSYDDMLAELADQPDWMAEALCPQVDPEIFFPEEGESTAGAKKICAACPVEAECLRAALDASEPFGIWGGQATYARRELDAGQVAA